MSGKLQTPDEIRELQLKGLEQAMAAYDWRYMDGSESEIAYLADWDLLLTAGKVVTITAPTSGAKRIEAASERAGDDALFMIAAAGTWS